jgi:hypothetical protein
VDKRGFLSLAAADRATTCYALTAWEREKSRWLSTSPPTTQQQDTSTAAPGSGTSHIYRFLALDQVRALSAPHNIAVVRHVSSQLFAAMFWRY